MLEKILNFAEKNSNVMADIDERNGKEGVLLTVAWVNSGFSDDEIDREHKLVELFNICKKIEANFDVAMEDVDDWDDEKEAVLISLI